MVKQKTTEYLILDYFHNNVIINGNRPRNGINYSGVYLINFHYIGESGKIKDRIKKHIQDSVRGTHCNDKLAEYLIGCFLDYTPLLIQVIDGDRNREGFHIAKYNRAGFELFNKAIGRGGERVD